MANMPGGSVLIRLICCHRIRNRFQARLPRFKDQAHHDPRCTGGHFGILVSCDKGQEPKLVAFFEERGGKVATFE